MSVGLEPGSLSVSRLTPQPYKASLVEAVLTDDSDAERKDLDDTSHHQRIWRTDMDGAILMEDAHGWSV